MPELDVDLEIPAASAMQEVAMALFCADFELFPNTKKECVTYMSTLSKHSEFLGPAFADLGDCVGRTVMPVNDFNGEFIFH